MLRTTSLFFPDGQAGGQIAARSLRWAFHAKSEGGKERESERGDGGVGDDDGGERERQRSSRCRRIFWPFRPLSTTPVKDSG
jgi:hypothetical protein